jgi:outer membrane protein assembly factor BamB
VIVSLVFLLVTSSAQAQPQINSLSKTTSARSGLVLINGTNFGSQQATGHVLIDGISAIVPTWTDTEIQAYVPESAGLGATTVRVETAGGVSNAKTLDVTLRQSEGRFRWRFEMGFRSSGAWTAIAPDGTIYCSDPFRLYALTPDGALKWLVQDAGGERPISVSAEGTIYTATNLAAGEVEGVIALNPDGSTRWTFIPETSGGFGVDLLAGPSLGPDGNIYAASNINLGGPGTFSLDADGTLLWSNSSSGPGSNSITNYEILFDGDQVYVTLWGQSGGPEVLTYDVDGDLLWTTGDLGLAIGSAPEIDPFGRLIMQWALIGVQAVDRDGSLQWIYDPPGTLGNVVGPTVGPDGVIYAGTWGGGDLFAINPDGTTKWMVEDQVAGFLWHMVVSPDNSTLIDGGAPDFGQPSTIRGFDTANGTLRWIQDFHYEEGLNEFAAWIEPNFSHDGTTIYVNTEFSSNTKPANLYAVDVSPQGNPTEVTADSFIVTRGLYVSGDETSLTASDNVDLALQRSNSDVQSRTEFQVMGISPTTSPASLEVTLEGAVFARSTVVQTIELWDYVAGAWELVDARNATNIIDSTATVAATGDLSRFVDQTTLSVEARIQFQSVSPRQQFASNTDQFIWTIGR